MAHRDERLSALFHPTLGYCFEKLHDGIFNAHPLGAPSLEQIKELIAAFASALEKRGLAVDAYSGIRDWYDEIAQPIAELEAFFEHRSQLHPQILSIIASHVKDQVALLKKMAGEIDQEWSVENQETD